VAVEKLLPAKLAKIKSRQEAPQSIFSGWVDIFYPLIFACSGRKRSFSTATSVDKSLIRTGPAAHFVVAFAPENKEFSPAAHTRSPEIVNTDRRSGA
jgi:hypothetical protein